jgi:hypothetical protein
MNATKRFLILSIFLSMSLFAMKEQDKNAFLIPREIEIICACNTLAIKDLVEKAARDCSECNKTAIIKDIKMGAMKNHLQLQKLMERVIIERKQTMNENFNEAEIIQCTLANLQNDFSSASHMQLSEKAYTNTLKQVDTVINNALTDCIALVHYYKLLKHAAQMEFSNTLAALQQEEKEKCT